MRREFKSVLFFSGACLAAGARAEADPQLTALIAEQLQKVQAGLQAPALSPAMATLPEGALESAEAEASPPSAEASVPANATAVTPPAEGSALVVKDAEGLDLRWPWQRHAAPDAPLPDGVVTAPVAPGAPEAVVVDSGEQWYLRNIWVRLRARGGFRVPGIVSVRAVPEIEMEWQRAFPKGWKQFEPAARR